MDSESFRAATDLNEELNNVELTCASRKTLIPV